MKRKNMKKKDEMSMDRKRGLYQSMAKLGDYKTRRAREDFSGRLLKAARSRPGGSRKHQPLRRAAGWRLR